VQCSLYVSGPSKKIKIFQAEASGNGQLISLERLYPCPKELRDTAAMPGLTAENVNDEESLKTYNQVQENMKKYGHPDWYHWCISAWGCKWDLGSGDNSVYLCHEVSRPTKVVYEFDTAWSHPREAFLKISTMFPELEFELCFQEGGCAFEGTFTCKNGTVSCDDTHDYIPEDDEDEYGGIIGMEGQVNGKV
jgi:hypothetical protein